MLELVAWGSLLTSLILGVFMGVQASLSPSRKRAYLLFSVNWLCLAGMDASLVHLGSYYEPLRVLWCGSYMATLCYLFLRRRLLSLVLAVLVSAFGFFWYPLGLGVYATTCSFVLAFGIAATFHGMAYWKGNGYASSILFPYALAQALLCATYVPVISSGDPVRMQAGYVHYFFLNAMALLFGWIHLPRELSGRVGVNIEKRLALIHFGVIVGSELGIYYILVLSDKVSIVGTVLLTLLMFSATVLIYFVHHHRLVIYTDNIEHLLEVRTHSLKQAQVELSRQNDLQAFRLQEQAKELTVKASIIGRQRRLELAGQTAGGVAHDLANFIRVLDRHLVKVDCQLESYGDSLGIREDFSSMSRQVSRLYELNQQLLSMSRRGSVRSEDFYTEDLCEELQELLKGRPLVIHNRVPRALVRGSRSQLVRTLANLSLNAFEADPGGEVILEVEREEVTALRECHMAYLKRGTYLRWTVSDGGSGVDEDSWDHIFEPFFSKKTQSSMGSGTGLGLSVVAGIVDDHGGTIDVKNLNPGCSFSVYLPEPEPEPESKSDHRSAREVLQDDTHLVSICDKPLPAPVLEPLKLRQVKVCYFPDHEEAIKSTLALGPCALLYESGRLSEENLLQWLNLYPDLILMQLVSGEESIKGLSVENHHVFRSPLRWDDIYSALKN